MPGIEAFCCSLTDIGKQFWHPEEVSVIWVGSIAGGGEGGISHPRLCAGAGERSRGPGEDSLLYFPSSVADQDPGFGAFLTPGFGIRNRFFPDPGSRISDPRSQTHTFESLVTIFG
jgi:hypothetical protein